MSGRVSPALLHRHKERAALTGAEVTTTLPTMADAFKIPAILKQDTGLGRWVIH